MRRRCGMLGVLLLAVVVGACFGGWQSLHHYRQLDMAGARRCAWRGILAAGVSGVVLTFVMVGWPFREQSATPEIVMRQIERPVRVPFLWLFWKWGKETVNVPGVGGTPPSSFVFD